MSHALYELQVRELKERILSLQTNAGEPIYTDRIYVDKLACYIVEGVILLSMAQMSSLVSNEHDRGARPIDGNGIA